MTIEREDRERRVLPGCLLLTGVLFALIAGIVAVVLALLPTGSRVAERPFDHELWLAASDRRAMVEDLLEEHLHTGTSRREVLDLLGPPDERVRIPRMPNTTFVWRLGEEKGLVFSKEARLVVEFDVHEHVTRAYAD